MKRHIPNMITCCNLICGCIATGTAFSASAGNIGQYMYAVIFIVLGAVFDFFDGMTARALGVSSPIGKELDSLADVVTFGVAPSAMLFGLFRQVCYPEWLMPMKDYLPYLAFLMAACSALRLAKFNLDTRQSTQFIGLPTPANALFWGSLIVGQFGFLISERFNVLFLIALMLVFCWLLLAEVPMLALKFKNLSWKDNKVKYIFVLGCLPCFLLGKSCFAAIIVWYTIISLFAFRTSK